MMGWLVFLAILLGYFWMVRREAIGFAQREVEDLIRRYEILYRDDPSRLDRERRETLMMGYFYGLFWPIVVPFRVLVDRTAQSMPKSSYELKQENARQARRITELERELGIGRKEWR